MTIHYNIGAVSDWHEVGNGEILRFDLPQSGIRQANFEVLADDLVTVIASNADGHSVMVGHGSGHMSIKFGMSEEMTLTCVGPDGCSIWIKTRVQTQVMAETGEPTFTDIEPRRMTQSEKVTRIQEIMAMNAQKRVAQLIAGLDQKTRELDEKLASVETTQPAPSEPGEVLEN